MKPLWFNYCLFGQVDQRLEESVGNLRTCLIKVVVKNAVQVPLDQRVENDNAFLQRPSDFLS